MIRGADVVEMVDYALAFNVALDSLPAVRRHAIEVLFARNEDQRARKAMRTTLRLRMPG